MLRISRITNTFSPVNARRIEAVQEIFRENFGTVADYPDKIPAMLNDPFKHRYRSLLLICERKLGGVLGFSLFLTFPESRYAFLDFIAVKRGITGSGLGGALYEATQNYARGLGCKGLFMEVACDDPKLVTDRAQLRDNQKRLAFYERYGLRPVIGTSYETPIDEDPAPYLLFDDFGTGQPLLRDAARKAVRLILQRKYHHVVSPAYIEMVTASFSDDPVRFREPRYAKQKPAFAARSFALRPQFLAVTSEHHVIHHVPERGYVERPARIPAILKGLAPLKLFETVSARPFGEKHLREVHDHGFLNYLKRVCEIHGREGPIYPYVFPIRRPDRPPKELPLRAGYYCIDTFTPLSHSAYAAARSAVDAALTAVEELLKEGYPLTYAICRPPGHHAQSRAYGGFCYFNNAAVAVQTLSKHGKTALLDIDFHHGNGSQEIFYERNDVLTLSIHGHPNYAYPYFSGFTDETGAGPGRGFNVNYPLPEDAREEAYMDKLEAARRRIRAFEPRFLTVSLGFDIMKGDPTGSFGLTPRALREIGHALGRLNLPTLVVQEGGYSNRNLRSGSAAFFQGFAEALL